MAYCNNCGHKINDNAKFCENCGAVIQSISRAGNDSRQQIFDGVIHKCPNCGEVLDAFVSVCPACGYELRGAKVSDSVRTFANKLEQLESQRTDRSTNTIDNVDRQIISLISSFPVPNTKEDLFEFVTLAAANIDTNALDNSVPDDNPQKAISKAWKAKLSQVYNKSIMTFEDNDPRLVKITKVYEQAQEKLKKQEEKQAVKFKTEIVLKLSGAIISVVLTIIAIVLMLVSHDTVLPTASVLETCSAIILIVTAAISRKSEDGLITSIGVLAASIIELLLGIVFSGKINNSMIILAAVIAAIISIVSIGKRSTKHKSV